MATQTTKLGLDKPATTDLVDIAVLNTNFDDIDAAAGATICTSATRPVSPWNGQFIYETDTLTALVWRASTSTWTPIGGSTVSSDPPTTAANGDLWWDSDNGKLYIYYVDANSSQWVSVMPAQTTVEVAQNVIINGDFAINQRNFTSTTTNGYGFDRWKFETSGGTATHSAQAFAIGAGPSGYEASNYVRIVTTGQSASTDFSLIGQPIEDVRTLAGKTITVSFYAKAASGTPKIAVDLGQYFGTGGSPSASVDTFVGSSTISTTWTRYSMTVALPSISGKVIGTTANSSANTLRIWVSAGSTFAARTGSMGTQANTFDIWGVQVEEGSVATSFRLAGGGTKQAELAACQRYYHRVSPSGTFGTYGTIFCSSSTTANLQIKNPVTMRIAPSSIDFGGGLRFVQFTTAGATVTGSISSVTFSSSDSTQEIGAVVLSGTGMTPGAVGWLSANNTSSSYIGFSAEL